MYEPKEGGFIEVFMSESKSMRILWIIKTN